MRVEFKLAQNLSQHVFHPQQHVVVPETNDAVTVGLQKTRALVVLWRALKVLAAIEFDDQRWIKAEEIDNVRSYWNLAAEFVTAQLPVAQSTPQGLLRIRGCGSELTCAWNGSSRLHVGPPSPQPSPASGRGDKNASTLSPSLPAREGMEKCTAVAGARVEWNVRVSCGTTLTLALSFMPSGYASGRGEMKMHWPLPPLPLAYPEGIKERARVRVVPMFHERSRKPSVQQPRAIHAAGGAECPGALAE